MSTTIQTTLKALTLCALASPFFGVFSADAQQQRAQGETWFKVCSKQEENDICSVQYSAYANTRQVVTAVNLTTIKGKINRRVFQVIVPTYRFIPAGVTVQIDQSKANKIPFSICVPDRCLADVQLTDQLVAALKKGNKLTITSVNVQNKKAPIEVSLDGFTAAYDGPPLKQTELESRQKKLQEELQKKAEEARKKLEEAQKKAKSE